MTTKIHLPLSFLLIAAQSIPAYAHAPDDVSEDQLHAPLDVILFLHMGLQALVWGVLFPIGMVFGLTRSRWHVPLQSLAFALTFAGIILGHAHGGRRFPHSFHGSLGSWLLLPILAQLSLGIYLKLHVNERTLRPYAVRAHGILGRVWPILGWVQGLFGVIVLRGFCGEAGAVQCAAHYIMGSAFIGYGIIMALLLVVGEHWVRRSGRSPEWWDSWVIMLWGIVNTFTQHHGGGWSVKDMQHTYVMLCLPFSVFSYYASVLGVTWWAGGALGIYLARNNQAYQNYNIILHDSIILTGWAMSEHAQALMLSTKVHAMFGYTLMLAGLARIIDICFITTSSSAGSLDGNESEHTFASGTNAHGELRSKAKAARAFRHLPPFVRVPPLGRLLFMSATDEELEVVHDMEMDHVTYVLGMYSLAFLFYLFTLFLLNLYATSGRNADTHDVVFSAPLNGEIELTSPRDASRWYAPVPKEEGAMHVLGEDEE
ncbi:hypothetical protein J3R82DRAFT_2626 [Butyriboletus roseoflavus]|nr:hypothetical protein J3R82DRAFT_2626 [Butyriboletus roseoflavus]